MNFDLDQRLLIKRIPRFGAVHTRCNYPIAIPGRQPREKPVKLTEALFWGTGSRPVDATEVIPAVPEHHGGAVVLPLFAEAVGEAREPSQAHSQTEIGSLDYGSADMIRAS